MSRSHPKPTRSHRLFLAAFLDEVNWAVCETVVDIDAAAAARLLEERQYNDLADHLNVFVARYSSDRIVAIRGVAPAEVYLLLNPEIENADFREVCQELEEIAVLLFE